MMTRKDYVEFANAIGDAIGARFWGDSDSPPLASMTQAEAYAQGLTDMAHRIASEIADVLARDNGNFRRGQFLEAIAYRAETGKRVKVGQSRFDR